MPIPTDTFWNIKRLNWIFAVSAIALMGTTVWSILRDHYTGWRVPQRNGRVWEAAIVSEKITSAYTPDQQARLKDLQAQINGKQSEITSGNKEFEQRVAQMRQLESDRATTEFNYNTVKSDVGVLESNLQDAQTAGEKDRVESIERKLVSQRKLRSDLEEKLAAKKEEIQQTKEDIDRRRAELDKLLKEQSQLTGDVELMKKKLVSLQPGGLGTISTIMRDFPL